MFKALILAVISLFTSASMAASSGSMNCFFELVTKSSPFTTIKKESFQFNVMDNYFNDFSFPELQNKLYVAYYPGLVAKDDLRVFVINLKYAGANAGADVPVINGGHYVFKISQDQSDLIGAFMNCTAEVK